MRREANKRLFTVVFEPMFKNGWRTSLVVQWLIFCPPLAGGLGSIPGQGTRSHMLQPRVHRPKTKTWSSKINK